MLPELLYILKDVKQMKNKILGICSIFLLLQTALGALESEISTIGSIQSSSKSSLSTQVSGRVENIYIEIGNVVKKNQPLIQLDKRLYEIDLAQKAATLDISKVEMLDAKTNFLRMQKLWEKPTGENPSISLKRYEEAKSKYDQALAQVKEAQEIFNRAKWNLEETTIKSPYDGIITQKFINIGESIDLITKIVEVQSLHPLYLEFSIPQVYATSVQLGTPLKFKIDGLVVRNDKSQIDLFYPSLDETTHSLRCRAIIDNRDFKIRPGALARVTIQVDTSDSSIEGNKL